MATLTGVGACPANKTTDDRAEATACEPTETVPAKPRTPHDEGCASRAAAKDAVTVTLDFGGMAGVFTSARLAVSALFPLIHELRSAEVVNTSALEKTLSVPGFSAVLPEFRMRAVTVTVEEGSTVAESLASRTDTVLAACAEVAPTQTATTVDAKTSATTPRIEAAREPKVCARASKPAVARATKEGATMLAILGLATGFAPVAQR